MSDSDLTTDGFWDQVFEKPVNLYMGHAHVKKWGKARKCTNKHCRTFITLEETCPQCFGETKPCGK